ncbi:hypothetical protein EY04_21780 [Pseudomonas chlororaphis]|nr:hypothetical protein EY04_21780 [Pseudomonas chlororaphis]
MPISIRRNATGHLAIGCLVIQQVLSFIHDCVVVGTDQFNDPVLHRFRTLSFFAQNQYWLTQCWCFFLHTTGIGQNQISALHRSHEWCIFQWIAQHKIGNRTKQFVSHLLDVRVWMHRIKELNVRIVFSQGAQRTTNIEKGFAEILPTVRSHEHQSFTWIKFNPQIQILCSCHEQRIDHSIASDDDIGVRNTFTQ